ncbi:hypothetical protein F5Y13DRAFT_199714 [Hypoxylon sp. FL1857]|nr:hypothetical protein F5Y13DRAFT_199714 [Hypoxylon sp. FL1857]
MANHRKPCKWKTHKRNMKEASNASSGDLPIGHPGPSSLYGNQLASPPASSAFVVPSSPPEVGTRNPNILVTHIRNEEDEAAHEVSQPTEDANGESIGAITPSSDFETEPPRNLARPQRVHQATLVPDAPENPKHLSLSEKVKLLRISCNNGARFLHCPTLGKHAEEEVWTAIMEEFSTTVRAGVFTKYTQVKKANTKICRNRRKRTEGTVPPARRSQMRNLDKWIDRWVRVWKCRDLVINIANAHQSIRETIGEKKLKQIFSHRMDGNELPPELGVLTFSAPLWNAIQKRIRAVERSLGDRHFTLFPGEDESDWMDEDDPEDDAAAGEISDAPPMQSIEEDFQNDPSPTAPETLASNPSREAEIEPDLPIPSPCTQARLEQLERRYVALLKEEQNKTGKQTSILGLAQKSLGHEWSPDPVPGDQNQPLSEENRIMTPEPRLQTSCSNNTDKLEHHSASSYANNPAPERIPCSDANIQRTVGSSSLGLQRLIPGTYSAGRTRANLQELAARESRLGQLDSTSTLSSSQSIKRPRCQSIGDSQSNIVGGSSVSSPKRVTVSEPLEPSSSTNSGRPPKRQKQSPEFESVSDTRPASGLEDQSRQNLFSSSQGILTAPSNQASCEGPSISSDGPEDKGKGKASRCRVQDEHRGPNSRPLTENGHSSNRKRGGRKKFTSSHRPSSYEQPDESSSTSAMPWKRRKTNRGKQGRREEHGRHNQTNNGNNRNKNGNRFLREKTTDTVDFENFSPDRKLGILRREVSRMREMLRKVMTED